jgi:hypothetical protein
VKNTKNKKPNEDQNKEARSKKENTDQTKYGVIVVPQRFQKKSGWSGA